MEGHVDGPLAVVSLLGAIGAKDARRPDAKSRLLADLSANRLIRTLARLDEATGQLPTAAIRFLAAFEHQKASASLYERKRGDRQVVVMHEVPALAAGTAAIATAEKRGKLIAANGAKSKRPGAKVGGHCFSSPR